LQEARAKEIPAYVPFLDQQVRFLDDALEQARIPERYRVAVVGRFKVGKSNFVNKLAGERLAGVDTNPETAAISIFRYDPQARAEVELISREEWERLEADHADDPKNPELKRYDRFVHFNERPTRRDKDGKELARQPADLKVLIDRWVRPGGFAHRIDCADWNTKEGKKRFLADIRKFTSSQEPLHYLVNKLTIYAPIPILRDQIELIDTPGLEDTERYRVLLTEELVKVVDAILFLTESGAAYSQGDKEFIVRQLRRRQIKHLQLIVTKSDATFANKERDARENDDPPPDYGTFQRQEIDRVRREVQVTLNELLQSNELSDEEGYYFIEQLDNVPVNLISTKYHDDGDINRGGIEAVRDGLYRILSTSQRFAHARSILVERLDAGLKRLRDNYRERLGAIEQDFDPKRVREEIEAIRNALASKLDFFAKSSEGLVALLKKQQDAFNSMLPTHLDVIGLLAREALTDLEKVDLIKHWRTRRVGRWGYLSDLQSKVADRVFPKVESRLNELRAQMKEFMAQVSVSLSGLQTEMRHIEEEHRLSVLEPLALADSQQPLFQGLEQMFDTLITSARDSVISRLDEFVSAEVQERLDKTRETVSNIWGTGTTWRQGEEVRSFYDQLRSLLGQALRAHLEARMGGFAKAILDQAESVAPRIRQASEGMIQQRLAAIESTLAVATADEKEKLTAYFQQMVAMLTNFAAEAPPQPPAPPPTSQETTAPGSSQARIITSAPATEDAGPQPTHYEIPENATGYTYERIFRPYIDGAEEIIVEDPHIRAPHQVDNFARFCALAIRLGSVKKIILKSGANFGEDLDDATARLETLRRDLRSRSVDLSVIRDSRIHDREIRFSNGWVVKIGRGLDIYQKPDTWVSLEALDFTLRRCRQTKVDVFRGGS
jgi:hypothetical protein